MLSREIWPEKGKCILTINFLQEFWIQSSLNDKTITCLNTKDLIAKLDIFHVYRFLMPTLLKQVKIFGYKVNKNIFDLYIFVVQSYYYFFHEEGIFPIYLNRKFERWSLLVVSVIKWWSKMEVLLYKVELFLVYLPDLAPYNFSLFLCRSY